MWCVAPVSKIQEVREMEKFKEVERETIALKLEMEGPNGEAKEEEELCCS